jgi:hypothetical protein
MDIGVVAIVVVVALVVDVLNARGILCVFPGCFVVGICHATALVVVGLEYSGTTPEKATSRRRTCNDE